MGIVAAGRKLKCIIASRGVKQVFPNSPRQDIATAVCAWRPQAHSILLVYWQYKIFHESVPESIE
jgi:hypothetical protein